LFLGLYVILPLLVPCGKLSWISVSFSARYRSPIVSHRIISYVRDTLVSGLDFMCTNNAAHRISTAPDINCIYTEAQ